MIDSENLRTASVYINNQLLSRGLIRDGDEIDFSDPAGGRYGEAGGDEMLAHTMGRVMAVVNDLILRRDRDASHRESLSSALRTSRAESLRAADDVARLSSRLVATERRLASSEAASTSARSGLASAEAACAALRDELKGARALVQQTRQACATDVRRRDRQIEQLRKAAADAGRVRGERRPGAVAVVTVEAEVRGGSGGGRSSTGSDVDGCRSDATAGQDLARETNEYLAAMVRTMGDENERLLALARDAAVTLRELSGLDHVEGGAEHPHQRRQTQGSDDHAHHDASSSSASSSASLIFRNPSTSELEADFAGVLAHLRTLLTNPSFVPIEEVEERDDEIGRLRDGWDKMESRWKEAVHLMDGWRRRISAGGKTVNVEELRMGLRLSPVRVGGVGETEEGVLGATAALAKPEATPAPGTRLSAVAEEGEESEDELDQDHERSYLQDVLQRHQMQRQQQQQRMQDPVLRTPSPAESLHLVPAPPTYEVEEAEEDDDSDSDASSIFADDLDIEEMDTSEPNVKILQQSVYVEISRDADLDRDEQQQQQQQQHQDEVMATAADLALDSSPPLPAVPQISPLKETGAAANRGFGVVTRPPTTRLHGPRPQQQQQQQQDAAVSRPSRKRPAPDLTSALEDESRDAPTTARRHLPATARFAAPTLASTAAAAKQPSPQKRQKPSPTCAAPAPAADPEAAADTSTTSSTATVRDDDSVATLVKTSPAPPPNPRTPAASRGGAARMQTVAKAKVASPAPNSSGNGAPPSTAKKPASSSTSSLKDAELMPPPPAPGTISRSNSKRGVNSAAKEASLAAPSPSSRLPLPRTNNISAAVSSQAPPPQSPLSTATIAAKLAASEREADAARVRAKLKAARLNRQANRLGGGGGGTTGALGPAAAQAAAAGAARRDSLLPTAPVAAAPSSPIRLVPADDAGGEDKENDHHHQQADAPTAAPVKRKRAVLENPQPPPLPLNRRGGAVSTAAAAAAATEPADSAAGDAEDGPQPPAGLDRPRKRERRASKVASRRRSTLSPWELESLISGAVVAGTAR